MLNQKQIKHLMYATLAEIKAVTGGRDNLICFCAQTGTFYKYLTSGGSYTANNQDVLITGDGGNTRWIAVSGKYGLSNISYGDFYTKAVDSGVITPIKYGVKVEITNQNPETSVTYIDDAIGLSPSVSSGTDTFNDNGWSNRFPFNTIKPCLLKDGMVVGYLDPDDYSKYEDGTAADITTGNSGDVMIEIPKMYMKISEDATYRYFEISNMPEEGFTDYPFSYKGVVKDKFYIGAYKGFNLSGKLKSLSGKTPTASQTRATFRGYAQANGEGYEIVPYNKLILLQILYLIRFKNLDSQTALGRGNVDASSLKTTGATNALGMCYGSTTGTTQMKYSGIEDFWGNIWEWIDGLTTVDVETVHHIFTQDGNFTDNATGATSRGTFAANSEGYMSDILGTNELGFLIKSTSGSLSTYYCDYGSCSSGCIAQFGGYWAYGSATGAFVLVVSNPASNSNVHLGARLAFCG